LAGAPGPLPAGPPAPAGGLAVEPVATGLPAGVAPGSVPWPAPGATVGPVGAGAVAAAAAAGFGAGIGRVEPWVCR